MIEVQNLTKYFDSIKAVDDITAVIKEGEVFGLVGTNLARYILKHLYTT